MSSFVVGRETVKGEGDRVRGRGNLVGGEGVERIESFSVFMEKLDKRIKRFKRGKRFERSSDEVICIFVTI